MLEQALIGVDVGGTHTDVSVAQGRRIVRGKALTTHDEYGRGIVQAITVAAEKLGVPLEALLSETDALVNATTVVTNSLTEMRGSKVGVLTTRGFMDTFRFAGGARRPVYDDHQQLNPPDVVSRDCFAEIDERVDRDGSIVVPLNEDQVRNAVQSLRRKGVDALAVCFLWSFRNEAHERRALELIAEEWPDVFVTLSSEIHSVIREHERFYSAVFNSFCQSDAVRLLDNLSSSLEAEGFRGNLTYFSGAGGAIPREIALRFPLLLLGSGPAGGVRAAIDLARHLGIADILVGDMGGTSFDTSLIRGLEPVVTRQIRVAGVPVGVGVLDIVSIGAGGGSIAWVDARGVPQVGPESAGSDPGPACYGRGGDRPTVTDAVVVSRLIDADDYLGGRVALDLPAAESAIARFGDAFSWGLERSVDAILELAVTNMADALRAISVERGLDPRRFAMVAYGGSLPMFATRICDRLGIESVIVPSNSSVFSAHGLLVSDFLRRHTRSVEIPLAGAGAGENIARLREEMVQTSLAEASASGIDPASCQLRWTGGLRFRGQVFEIDVPLGRGDLSANDMSELEASFPRHYEDLYGAGTAWEGSAVVLVALNLTITAPRPTPVVESKPVDGDVGPPVPRSVRTVLMPGGEWRDDIPCFDGENLAPGTKFVGPAIVNEHDTTLFVGADWRCARDGYMNYLLNRSVQ